MKLKWQYVALIFGIAALLVFIVPAMLSMGVIFKKFHKLSQIERLETPFIIADTSFLAYNIKTNSQDTIKLKGLTILNFWATWCKPCIEEIPSLVNLKLYNPNTTIAIISFDSLAAQKAMISKKNWDLPAYYLTDTTLFKLPQILPITYVLKSDTVIEVVYGFEDWNNNVRRRYIDSISASVLTSSY